ncbi:MAG: biosynthetic-type acetolactate synthase large subunit [Oscillospiraceae bacterium]|nr:biosynthetic-type acetolactate synthase large subunit [Oscillospiraceae bacterium]
MALTGADILMECLLEQGVDTVFGYPGGQVLPLYDALYKYRGRLRHILTSHEQHAGHAADGYARASGKPGVCLATSGPGATNLVTAIATAYMDSVPVVFITGNVPQTLIGTDSFQEADISGITLSVTKHNTVVSDVRRLASTLREAFFIASSGRPGPVLVDIPKDVQTTACEYTPAAGLDLIPDYPPDHPALQLRPKGEQLDQYRARVAPYLARAAALIGQAERPLLYLGGGVVNSGATLTVQELADKMDAPVVSSLMGLGAYDPGTPRYLGLLGMHGSHAANTAMQECDLLLAVGIRFSDRALGNAKTFAPNARIIHIDIDRAEINKNINTMLHITGDARVAVGLLNERLGEQRHFAWNQRIFSLRDTFPEDERFSPRNILRAMHRVSGGSLTVATDVGQHQMWTAQHFPFNRARQFITSGGLGTMGFGLGAAMGARLSTKRPVALVTGDGSFRMNLTELSTLARYDIPVVIVLMNNGTLGMVRQWQTLFFDKHYSNTDLDRGPDFMKLADAYGLQGWRVDALADFQAAFRQALAGGRPCLVECLLHIDEMVTPMVAPGRPINEFCLD